MSVIRALDPATVRLLGSSLNITSPVALVKELVDNAIDAQATSIEVLVSPNTVDKIQVKDNGQGIGIDDYELLGRRAHTSKLRKFSELQDGGFQTIGFRGEALASANSIGTLTIITRTAEDPLATRLKLTPKVGGVETRSPASGLVGTTVKVERLFEVVPVRKQQALKESRKCIARIPSLLRAYAMARPYLKLSIKVPGEPKHSWDYTPSLTPSTRDAVMQIFGKDLAVGCEVVEARLSNVSDNSAYGDGNSETICTVEALLPRNSCDLKLVNGKGAFISVDSKPLSSSDGFGKKLTSTFKSLLKTSVESEDMRSKLSAPFVQVNIRCTGAIYDKNVSPLKDDVLFSDEYKILGLFETMCQRFYEIGNSRKHTAMVRRSPLGQEGPTHQAEDQECSHMLEPSLRASQSPERHIVQTKSTGYAEMRTSIKVDLGRTISTATDEDNMLEAVTIRIPSEPLVLGKCSAVSSASDESATKSLQSQATHHIHQYFKPMGKPVRKKSFEIATDDTATDEPSPDAFESPDMTTSGNERQPLRPLMESAINTVDSEVDEGLRRPVSAPRSAYPLSFSSMTGRSPLSEIEPTYRVVTPRNGVHRTSMPAYSPVSFSPLHRNPPLLATSAEWPLTSPSSPVVNDISTLRTPPPSNSHPGNRAASALLRPHIFQMAGHQRATRLGTERLNGRTTIPNLSGTGLHPSPVLTTRRDKTRPRSSVVMRDPLSYRGSNDEAVSEQRIPTPMRT